MSEFSKDEAANYQAEVRAKLQDLQRHIDDRWCRWTAWERGFISKVTTRLEHDIINISQKEYRIVWDLWERSLK